MSSLRLPAWLLAALLFAGCSRSSSTEAIVVGHLAPLSGPDKMLGEHARQGILLAVEEINGDTEKINGRPVEVHQADDCGPPAAAGNAAVRLVTVTRAVALLGGLTSERAEQIARAAQPGVPLVTPSPLPAPLAAETAFSTCPPPGQQGKALARFSAEELKVKHVAVLLDSRSAVCAGVAAAFVKEFRAAERQADQFRYENDTGLADLAARAAQAKPDAVLIATPVADFVKLREGLVKAEVKGPFLFGGEESAWPVLFAEAGAGHGVYAVTTFAADGLTARGQEFAKKYRERFQEAPDLYAASAYDGARLLFEAMRKAGPGKLERLREQFAGLENFDSLTGPLTIDKDDHGAHRPLFVVQRQEGEAKMVKCYDAKLP
ncbi:MAG TPA: ABC transporter substrate-binding protein [Gemmataceae bacterium]|nr:ABC transporter substrate-binding protein [Gemmataceae bacterium]